MIRNDLTITGKIITMPLVGQTEVRRRRTRDTRLGVTDYRMAGRSQIGRPEHSLAMVIQSSPMPKKTYFLLKAKGTLLTGRRNCPVHAEPVHSARQRLTGPGDVMWLENDGSFGVNMVR